MSVESDGLKSFILIDKWNHPDSIKEELKKMYHNEINPIEGVVFIGDIPIAMIRDAQHLTSAFKMNQERFPWIRSSVPSDRFYDDFDLIFDYIKRDTSNTLLHYYSLKPESAHKLQPEIYSGRIKPFNTENKYRDLKMYLKKLVKAKNEKPTFDQILFFAGHGYNSECKLARMDEKISLLEQFPLLNRQKNGIQYISHEMETHIKWRLMNELQRPNLDIALLHNHGGVESQYLNGMPKVDAVHLQIDGVKKYLRSKLRRAKKRNINLEERKQHFHKRLNVPLFWFDNTFDPKIIKKDSLFYANLDITIEEVKNFTPNARIIILDACFNGSFHLDSCISSAYIFNNGQTVVAHANSVNVLQDKWTNEFLGLIGMGLRFGNWNKLGIYLESHIIGDPTFRFNNNQTDLDLNLILNKTDSKFWLSMLDSELPDLQSLALRKLHKNAYSELSDILLSTFIKSPYGTVRMQCLKLLTSYNDNNFIECLKIAYKDSYELIRRQAIHLIGQSGDDRLIKPLVLAAMHNNISNRIDFNIKYALSFFDTEKVLKEFEHLFDTKTMYIEPEKVKKQIYEHIIQNTSRWANIPNKIFDPEIDAKRKKSNIRILRNFNYHPAVDSLCLFIKETENEELQIVMLETLGWFNISHKKDIIIATCNNILHDTAYSDKVRDEALRTLNRLKTPWYR